MEDEELERGKGELVLYLLRLALFLSAAVLLLQLVFLGWLVVVGLWGLRSVSCA